MNRKGNKIIRKKNWRNEKEQKNVNTKILVNSILIKGRMTDNNKIFR